MNDAELQKLYDEFIKDETIMGLKNLFNKYNIVGRYKEDQYKSLMYEKFGKDHLKSIFRKRLSNHTSQKFKEYKEEKLENLKSLSEKLYQTFIKDKTTCGLTSLFKKNKIGSKTGGHIREILYKKYGKENIDRISFKRTSSNSHKNRSGDSYKHSEETNRKISETNKKIWSERPDLKELGRENIKYCFKNSHSPQTNINRIKSRRCGCGWKDHTTETKNKLSVVFRKKWKNGDYDNRVKSFSSKSQIEIENIIKLLGYSVIGEYFINGRPYDVFVKEKNLIIEYNGTYWHFDPKVYDKNHYDKSSCKYAYEIWERDRIKIENAKKYGYDVKIIWENEWQKCQNKTDYIKKLLC